MQSDHLLIQRHLQQIASNPSSPPSGSIGPKGDGKGKGGKGGKGGRCSNDPSGIDADLLYLAGQGTNATSLVGGVASLGWTAGTLVVDRTFASLGFYDQMQVLTKDGTGTCAVAFSATDDALDQQQQLTGLSNPTSYCGLIGVHGGYVEEMHGFFAADAWTTAMSELSVCDEIYAVGHSLGGSLANLFAFCANQQGDGGYDKGNFSQLTQTVRLVTFGAPATSLTQMYSGVDGQSFYGARYQVASSLSSYPSPSFFIQLWTLYTNVTAAVGYITESTELSAVRDGLVQTEGTDSFYTLLDQAASALAPIHLLMWGIVAGSIPGTAALQERIFAFAKFWVSEFVIYSDGVSNIWKPFGYVHPRVPFVAFANEFGGKLRPTHDSDSAPSYAYLSYWWGTVANNGYFPWHHICCYTENNKACQAKFANHPAYTECNVPAYPR